MPSNISFNERDVMDLTRAYTDAPVPPSSPRLRNCGPRQQHQQHQVPPAMGRPNENAPALSIRQNHSATSQDDRRSGASAAAIALLGTAAPCPNSLAPNTGAKSPPETLERLAAQEARAYHPAWHRQTCPIYLDSFHKAAEIPYRSKVGVHELGEWASQRSERCIIQSSRPFAKSLAPKAVHRSPTPTGSSVSRGLRPPILAYWA
ncbi:hypothetical protein NP233_g7001 [Leucocoprinus birnbaumii]|uniref:Uncharacterized protein n=1 Tax=Leucocoprinus birnbaumii TaxID=56174 RepID=A0AAD5VVK4_9AGAR|nr:hypothetical protein NP233_g7001 [Leucocoprinus birnbaumii]